MRFSLSGPQYLFAGFRMINRPGLRRFAILPILINLLVFAALVWYSSSRFSLWVAALVPSLPDWLSFLSYFLWILFAGLVSLIIFFSFTTLTSLIASPFNAFLAEKVEIVARGEDPFPPFSWVDLLAMAPRSIWRELRKLGYFLPRAIGLLILSFIPGVNLFAAPLWLVFNIWMMAVQFIDYPADNNKVNWPGMLHWLRQHRWVSLSFGGVTYLAVMVPLFNLIAMPAAVAGGTLLWVDGNPGQSAEPMAGGSRPAADLN